MPVLSTPKRTDETHEPDMIRRDLPYHMKNLFFFSEFNREKVYDFLHERILALFHNISYKASRSGKMSWQHLWEAENLVVAVSGSSSVNSKRIVIDFNSSESLVKEIKKLSYVYNKIVDEFHDTYC